MLADFDELTLRCRSPRAKSYISEAIASYKVGAFRAAIVSTWIAVCFDLIEKIRELATAGDPEAELRSAELEAARQAADLSKALRFEREVLALARDKFELISHIEYEDLERLQIDRNRCAHPSLISEDEPFVPSAELARLHIRSAVTHLLQHPPAQGKFALQRVISITDSDLFPTEYPKALVVLSSSPLKNPRRSLVFNFLTVLIKRVVREDLSYSEWTRVRVVVKALNEMHPRWSGETFADKLPSILNSVDDADLYRVISLLQLANDVWQYFDGASQHRVEMYVMSLPSPRIEDLGFLLGFEPLRKSALARVGRSRSSDYDDAIFWTLPVEVGDHFVERLLNASNQNTAQEWINCISRQMSDITIEQLTRLVVEGSAKSVLLNSVPFYGLLRKFKSKKRFADELPKLLRQNNWDDIFD